MIITNTGTYLNIEGANKKCIRRVNGKLAVLKEPLQEGLKDTICEVLVYKLCEYLEIPCCKTGLVNENVSYSLVDEDLLPGMIPADQFLKIEEGNIKDIWRRIEVTVNDEETMLRLIQMFIIDVLTRQLDRNMTNFSFYITEGKVKLYPLYDNGISLFSTTHYRRELNYVMRTRDYSNSVIEFLSIIGKDMGITFKEIFKKEINKDALYNIWENYYMYLDIHHSELIDWVYKQFLNIKVKYC